jgi:glycosyltransferase involved in cell wall biosynthesis
MKIAIVDHISVSGGIIRYSTNLARAIKEADPSTEITFFTTEHNFNTNKTLFTGNAEFFETKILFNSKKTLSGSFLVDTGLYKIFRTSRIGLLKKEIYKKTLGFDIVYFTYAHASEYIPVKPKSMATYHDMNWKYLFGTPLYPASEVAMVNKEINKWFKTTGIIVSTPYVGTEIRKFFKDVKNDINVVFLPNLAKKISIESSKRDQVFQKLGIKKKYILCPAHLMPHKNHLNLFSAFHRFRRTPEGQDYILILTGHATDHFKYAKAIHRGAEMSDKEDFDIMGLGYVSNEDVDVLIKNASLIISGSLQEAGSGPALDAWINEVPVILSSIEPHLDQLSYFNIKCHTFDPMDIADISAKMLYAVTHHDELAADSRKASQTFEEYTWTKAGLKYLEIFKKHLEA